MDEVKFVVHELNIDVEDLVLCDCGEKREALDLGLKITPEIKIDELVEILRGLRDMSSWAPNRPREKEEEREKFDVEITLRKIPKVDKDAKTKADNV